VCGYVVHVSAVFCEAACICICIYTWH